ncbi:CASP-like protein [Platanthera zijinensis]|uniref:CASP-like protein n=1 Tax=Platanthera zijinensis TaxID=2320716 RepID=A0AAP0G1G5_9ASPA
MGTVLELPLTIGDVAAMIALFTGNAAAIAIEVVTWKSIPQFGWGSFCSITKSFCGIGIAAVTISSLAALIYFLLLVLSLVTIHKKYQN